MATRLSVLVRLWSQQVPITLAYLVEFVLIVDYFMLQVFGFHDHMSVISAQRKVPLLFYNVESKQQDEEIFESILLDLISKVLDSNAVFGKQFLIKLFHLKQKTCLLMNS